MYYIYVLYICMYVQYIYEQKYMYDLTNKIKSDVKYWEYSTSLSSFCRERERAA